MNECLGSPAFLPFAVERGGELALLLTRFSQRLAASTCDATEECSEFHCLSMEEEVEAEAEEEEEEEELLCV